jgi:hypothetical protein
MGLMGTTGVRTGSLVPRAQTPDADQRLWQEFQEAGRIADPDIWTKFNSIMKRPTTFEAMLQLWDEMAQWDLIAAALVEIVDEATQADANSPGTLWYQCNDSGFEEELNDLLVRLEAEQIIQSQVWHIASLGNHFEKLEYAPQEGVMGMSFVHPMDMRRYWLERNRKCIGFRWLNHKPNKEDVFVMPDNRTPVERVSLASGQHTEDLFYPWDFLHFRRMYRMRISEHGEPIFAEADGIYKKLRLAIDQMVVCRAQVQPDRLAISIDVQEQPPIEQMKTIQRWRQTLRSKLAFGQVGTASDLNSAADFSAYYNALALDTIIYLAQPKGFNNVISKLPGTPDVPDVYDIELLTDLFYSIIGMPKAWFGGNSDGEQFPSGKALLAQDIRFLRKIKSIRRPLINSYQWLAYFHAVLKGKNVEELDIKAMMSPVGSLEEQLKMEMLSMQADVLAKLGDVMEQYKLPKEAWIETVFKRYMHLPDEVVNVFLTALPGEVEQQDQQKESQKRPAPSTLRLLSEIHDAIKQTPGASDKVRLLREVIFKERLIGPTAPEKSKWTREDVLNRPVTQENDLVISSFGKHPFELKRSASPSALKESKNGTGMGYVGGTMKRKVYGARTAWDDDGAAAPAVTESNGSANEGWDKYRKFMPTNG